MWNMAGVSAGVMLFGLSNGGLYLFIAALALLSGWSLTKEIIRSRVT